MTAAEASGRGRERYQRSASTVTNSSLPGEKKEERTKDEKDWHVEERSYGSFSRSMSLPSEPEDGDARFDKGVLHLTIKKPAKVVKTTETIEIKYGEINAE